MNRLRYVGRGNDLASREIGDGACQCQYAVIWEKGHTEPPLESMCAIIRVLGYDPFPEPPELSERLAAERRAMGRSIKKAAQQLPLARRGL